MKWNLRCIFLTDQLVTDRKLERTIYLEGIQKQEHSEDLRNAYQINAYFLSEVLLRQA